MTTRTITHTAAILTLVVGALGATIWTHSSMRNRTHQLEIRLEKVVAGMEPVHSRCEMLEGLLAETDEHVAIVTEASTALSRVVEEHESVISEDRDHLRRIERRVQNAERRLVESLEEMSRSSSDIRSILDEQARELHEANEVISGLAMQTSEAEEWRELLPEGTILPWLPDDGGVPPGWLVCDGSSGTPDLRGRFLRGVGRFSEAGLYDEGAQMQPEGLHTHATDSSRNVYMVPRGTPKKTGDWLLLFDSGVESTDTETRSDHGSHVHEDEHVPQHFTVAFIMKGSR